MVCWYLSLDNLFKSKTHGGAHTCRPEIALKFINLVSFILLITVGRGSSVHTFGRFCQSCVCHPLHFSCLFLLASEFESSIDFQRNIQFHFCFQIRVACDEDFEIRPILNKFTHVFKIPRFQLPKLNINEWQNHQVSETKTKKCASKLQLSIAKFQEHKSNIVWLKLVLFQRPRRKQHEAKTMVCWF